MAQAIPTTLLCGFLGSGKTTRINSLIRSGALENALFLVNDFGRINIDAALIESREDNILRLDNGCACCGISGNLSAQLRDIKRWSRRPTHLVFEASGIARPRPLQQLFAAAQGYRLDESETLVDASAFERHHRDAAISDLVIAQIQEVSRLRINRVNWLTDEQREHLLQRIAAINPAASWVLEEAEGPPPTEPATVGGSSGALVTESLPLPHPIDVEALNALLAAAAPSLVRAKGLVRANDRSGTRYVVQFAGGRTTRVATSAGRTQALVVIGHQSHELRSLLAALREL
ncbi:CobW family GTP-binding protein [Litchfieldella rifensis]|uniref:CobW family GTP-binding protein n=1 Tax=Litchfieldella rifensis TaxID=762643 RepID=A0ABV7LMP3_9GAMM